MKNLKYEFLKEVAKPKEDENERTHEDVDIIDAWDNLQMFYDYLPEKAKTETRQKEFEHLTKLFKTAFDSQVKKIADCPYIKIEIANQPEQSKLYADAQLVKECILILTGYCGGETPPSLINRRKINDYGSSNRREQR